MAHRALCPSLLAALALALALAAAPGPAAAGAADAYYADDADGVFYFLHLSDSHIGAITSGPYADDHNSHDHLVWGLGEAVQVVQPVFVVMTGDLTDASWSIVPAYGPQQDEWDTYKSIVAAAGMTPTFYYDVIGNHDLYADQDGPHYLANSLQGQTHHSWHFDWTHSTSRGDYYFFAMNNIGNYMAPFTYGIGEVTDAEFNALQAGVLAHTSAPLTIVFGHQPIDRPANWQRMGDLLGQHGAYYVHGDTHERHEKLVGQVVVNEITALGKGDQTTGQDNDNFAIVAIDHDAFIYRSGTTMAPWPFVVITAPVSHDLHDGADNPYAYKPCLHSTTSPVRALVFSKDPLTGVTAQVGFTAPQAMTPVAGKPHLYETHVDTTVLSAGFHDVTVIAHVGATSNTQTIAVDWADCTPVPHQQDGGTDAGGAGDGPAQSDAAPAHDGPAPADDGPAPTEDATGSDGGVVGAENGGGVGGGCGCRAAASGSAGGLGVALLVLALVLGSRRRRG
ncbi:MAG TPA: hypothetical protein VGQ83_21355 [Polyangia bacterium]|jgi:MYXO-CTERM domain-containing protein